MCVYTFDGNDDDFASQSSSSLSSTSNTPEISTSIIFIWFEEGSGASNDDNKK